MPYRRYYQIGGLTIQVESDLPITDTTFRPKFKLFEVDGPGEDTVVIRHHFSPFDFENEHLGERVYRKAPWAIYRRGDSWIYLSVSPTMKDTEAGDVGVLSDDHTQARMYHAREDVFLKGNLHSLTLFTTDQILLARVLADRQGCYLHSSGVILDGQGLLFVGQSEAGKSTISKMLQGQMEVLCDDRNIVRRQPEGFWVYGTWSHGEWPVVSASFAPLRAIMFLEKAPENRLIPLDDRQEILRRLLACLITPFVTAEWWGKSLNLVERIAHEVDCYTLRFDKSGGVVAVLQRALVA